MQSCIYLALRKQIDPQIQHVISMLPHSFSRCCRRFSFPFMISFLSQESGHLYSIQQQVLRCSKNRSYTKVFQHVVHLYQVLCSYSRTNLFGFIETDFYLQVGQRLLLCSHNVKHCLQISLSQVEHSYGSKTTLRQITHFK